MATLKMSLDLVLLLLVSSLQKQMQQGEDKNTWMRPIVLQQGNRKEIPKPLTICH
jgi:hypothetical protein